MKGDIPSYKLYLHLGDILKLSANIPQEYVTCKLECVKFHQLIVYKTYTHHQQHLLMLYLKILDPKENIYFVVIKHFHTLICTCILYKTIYNMQLLQYINVCRLPIQLITTSVIQYTLRREDESFFCVFLWILLNYKSFTSKTVLPHTRSLYNWLKCKCFSYISNNFVKMQKLLSQKFCNIWYVCTYMA